MFEDRNLFYGKDPEFGAYRTRAHLAEIIAVLGSPPPDFMARGLLRSKFFSEKGEFSSFFPDASDIDLCCYSGKFQAGIDVPPPVSLEELETNLEGSEKELFLRFVRKMLQWDPQRRQTAKQLLEDEWLKANAR